MSIPANQSKPALGLGLIGCGVRLRNVVKSHPEVEVVALCDPDEKAIAAARSAYGSQAKVYQDFRNLVADDNVDWVAIGSWNRQHKDHAIAALRAGKHVFCEKPLATSLADCLEIRRAVRESGKTFSFGLVLRYSALYQKTRDLLRSGVIGTIVSFEFNETLDFNHGGYIFGNWRRLRSNAGTHLLEKCCHDIDLANWLVGSLPVKVASFGGLNFFTPDNRHRVEEIGSDAEGREAYQTWPGNAQVNPFDSEKDIVDNQVAILEYANGVRATFHTNCNSGIPERRFYICGTEGTLRVDAMTGVIECQRIGFASERERFDTGAKGEHAGGDEALRESLIATMLYGTEPLVGVDEAIQSAMVAFAIDRALDTGTVVDLRADWRSAGVSLTEPEMAVA